MPTYEYRCLDCQIQYDKREGFDAPALQKCPTCGGTARRVLHAAPIVFKGSGFYVTDSRKTAESGGERSAPAAETAAAAPDGAKAPDGTKASDGAKAPDGAKASDTAAAAS